MSAKKISYLNRTFDDYKEALIEYTRMFYPEIANDLDDASIGTWLIELMAAMGDNLSYYIDRAYNETNVESAELKSSIYALARSNGLKVPGPKGAMTELEFSCELPASVSGNGNSASSLGMPNYTFAPIIKKGTRVVSASGQFFETDEDVDFSEQFNFDGVSNRNIIPLVSSNSSVGGWYKITKTCTATEGISKIYSLVVSSSMVKPFMEVVIPDRNIMNVESIILKDGTNFQNDPTINEFMINDEYLVAGSGSNATVDTYRFFEVDSLCDSYRWSDANTYQNWNGYRVGTPETYEYSYLDTSTNLKMPIATVVKGAWKPITQKFVTEYTDNGYMKVIFGGGMEAGQAVDFSDASPSSRNRISSMVYNNNLGVRPKAGTTMYILYRVGGGVTQNVAAGSINSISRLDAVNKTYPTTNDQRKAASTILSTIRVTNTIQSIAGKNMPTVDEIKNMIKYNSGAQNRCVTLKDYEDRISKMPPRYGSPFRVGVIEENNKVMTYVLMINSFGQLSDAIPSMLIQNMLNYLSMYKNLTDFVEVKSGRIINLSFEADLYIDKNYNTADVVTSVIQVIKDYMDINKRMLGEDIYVSDLEREIGHTDGVINLIDLRVYNEYGSSYSSARISQPTYSTTVNTDGVSNNPYGVRDEIDLPSSDYILNSEADEMFEIKYPEKDIRIRVKTR